jgi:SAM-dependent methyltransferase
MEARIYNNGERLIPGLTHDLPELIRHRSTYAFYRKIIALDQELTSDKPIRILDLGCGVGYGCAELSGIPNSTIIGVDMSPEAIEFARANYARDNVSYLVANIEDFVQKAETFEYVVSRHVLEHVRQGLGLCSQLKWTKRLLVDVPFQEKAGVNPHHLVAEIDEVSFNPDPTSRFFYQDLSGVIFDRRPANAPRVIVKSGVWWGASGSVFLPG